MVSQSIKVGWGLDSGLTGHVDIQTCKLKNDLSTFDCLAMFRSYTIYSFNMERENKPGIGNSETSSWKLPFSGSILHFVGVASSQFGTLAKRHLWHS